FGVPEFSIGSHQFQFFPGSLPVVRHDFLGIDLTSPTSSFVFASVVFAVLAFVVVAVRRSPFGARLIAIKEGPAAVATAGINVTAAKVGVFALSGAIAGVGGAVMSSASPASVSQFDLVAGLPILL